MWDLTRGRCTYTAKLDVEGEMVAFCPSAAAGEGGAYLLVGGTKATVHSAAGGCV